MKAWWVSVDDEWGDFVHAETRSKAKSMFWRHWAWEADQWIYLRAVREPKYDDKPFPIFENSYAACCNCELCKQED